MLHARKIQHVVPKYYRHISFMSGTKTSFYFLHTHFFGPHRVTATHTELRKISRTCPAFKWRCLHTTVIFPGHTQDLNQDASILKRVWGKAEEPDEIDFYTCQRKPKLYQQCVCVCVSPERSWDHLCVIGQLKNGWQQHTHQHHTYTLYIQLKNCSWKHSHQCSPKKIIIIITVYSPSKTHDLHTSQHDRRSTNINEERPLVGFSLNRWCLSHLSRANITSDSKYNIRILWAL